jgi:Uma2 family endonuclease
MGNLATGESLALRWAEVCRDSSLQDLPYKIELNSWGKIEMSPASYRHALLQGRTAVELGKQLSGGEVLTECPVLTEIGIRVPDVAWASDDFMRANGETTPCLSAPEICIEIRSPANSDAEIDAKKNAYLAAGAREVWVIEDSGAIRYFDSNGEKPASGFGVSISLPPRLDP